MRDRGRMARDSSLETTALLDEVRGRLDARGRRLWGRGRAMPPHDLHSYM